MESVSPTTRRTGQSSTKRRMQFTRHWWEETIYVFMNGRKFQLFTDHANLVHIVGPHKDLHGQWTIGTSTVHDSRDSLLSSVSGELHTPLCQWLPSSSRCWRNAFHRRQRGSWRCSWRHQVLTTEFAQTSKWVELTTLSRLLPGNGDCRSGRLRCRHFKPFVKAGRRSGN